MSDIPGETLTIPTIWLVAEGHAPIPCPQVNIDTFQAKLDPLPVSDEWYRLGVKVTVFLSPGFIVRYDKSVRVNVSCERSSHSGCHTIPGGRASLVVNVPPLLSLAQHGVLVTIVCNSSSFVNAHEIVPSRAEWEEEWDTIQQLGWATSVRRVGHMMERLHMFMFGREASQVEPIVFSLHDIIGSMRDRTRQAYLKVDTHEGRMVQRVGQLCEGALSRVDTFIHAANEIESIFMSLAKSVNPKNEDEGLAIGFQFVDLLEGVIRKAPSIGRFGLLANKIGNIAGQIQLRFLDPIVEEELRDQRRAVNKRLDSILSSIGIQ